MFGILKLIAISCVLGFIGFYLFYLTICMRYVKDKHKHTKDPITLEKEDHPTVSIIIPTYNEIGVIPKKIENLQALYYPKDKFQVVFVDGGSTDGTADLIESLAKDSGLDVRIVQQGQRKGFNNAVIEGFSKTTGEIICITGAETEYDLNALSIMVEKFRDPKIGAVTGKQKIKNIGDGYSPKLENAYRSSYDFLRQSESYIDSPFDIKGEISASRRSVLTHLVNNPKLLRRGCIDCCISFQAKKDGYRAVYEPSAFYFELSPTKLKDSFKQQIRRAVTLIENMMAFKDMILNKEFGMFGMLIMPAHFIMLIVLPFLLLIGSLSIVVIVILEPSNYLLLLLIGSILSATILSYKLQAFLKTQITLVIATLKYVIGSETQKFERLSSAR